MSVPLADSAVRTAQANDVRSAAASRPGAAAPGVRPSAWPLVRLLAYGRGAHGRLMLAGALGVVAAGSAVGLGATSAWLIARAAQHPPVLYLMVAVTAVRAFGIFRGAARYAERLVGHDAALRILGRLRVAVYRRLERLAPAGLDAFRSGDLTARLVSDVDDLADVWLRVLLPYAIAVVVGAGSVTLLAMLLPGAGLVLAATLVLVAFGAPWLAGRFARAAERRIAPRRGALAAATLETLRGAGELLAYGAADAAMDRVRARDAELSGAQRRSAAGLGVSAAVAALAPGAAVTGALLTGVPAAHAGTLSGVALAVVVLTPLAVHEVFSGLPPAAQQLPHLRAAAARILNVLDAPAPVAEPADPAPLPLEPQAPAKPNPSPDTPAPASGGPRPPAEPEQGTPAHAASGGRRPPAGAERVEDARPVIPAAASAVSGLVGGRARASYGLRVEELWARWTRDGPDVLRGLDLTVAAGQRVAIVGRSGAGKSTLAAVLLRFLQPARGRVLLTAPGAPDTDAAALAGDDVRRVVGLCAQDAYVFDSTIGANVRLARPDAGDADLRHALERARLWDWVATLPAGLDTPVGEHGVRLSGGQRQRLALARTLLADFPVVILDEPTEHLDEPTAAALTHDLLTATADRTVLLITHREAALPACDAVHTLDNGRLTGAVVA